MMSEQEGCNTFRSSDGRFHERIIIADKTIEIVCRYRYTIDLCKNYAVSTNKVDYVIEADDNRINTIAKYNKGIVPPIHYDGVAISPSRDVSEAFAIYQLIAESLIENGCILIHGAAISCGGRSYIFCANSGTGKTTHIMNWMKTIDDTYVLNGDKPLININEKKVFGTPWCGKEGMNTNAVAPLCGIIALERNETNSIIPVSFSDILPNIIQQTYIPADREKALRIYRLIGSMSDVPFYRLRCNIDSESAIIAHDGITINEKRI